MRRKQPVFLSYARRTSRSAAEALHRELGDEIAFLDTEDIEPADHFPRRLSEALLGSRLVVAFVDATYFQRWYCLREWMLALAPWRSSLAPGNQGDDRALAHLVIVLPEELASEDLLRMPPPSQRRSWLKGSDTQDIARHVRRRLKGASPTVREQLKAFQVSGRSLDILASDAVVPVAPKRLALPNNLESVDPSLHDRFVGRSNDLWSLHDSLSTQKYGGEEAEPLTVALQGVGGCGKTRLAIEYTRRFGPDQYKGGCFWLDASDPRALGRQFRSMLAVLGRTLDPKSSPEAVHQELGRALREQSGRGQVLYVVNGLPEAGPGEEPLPLRHYCPAIGHVSCLVTTRVLQGYGHLIRPHPVDVLDLTSARLLLTQGTNAGQALADEEWNHIANWCGRLPLALEVLNGVLVTAAATPQALLGQASRDEIAPTLDRHVERLRRSQPRDVVHGSGTEAFEFSYERLDALAQRIVRYLAWLAPAPIPLAFLRVSPRVQPLVDEALALLVARSLLKRVGPAQEAVEMHTVLASFLRSEHSAVEDGTAAFVSVARRFAELGDVERDAEARRHLLDLLPHLRWHTRRLSQPGAPEPLDEPALNVIQAALPPLQGLCNSTWDEAAALATLEICDLLESRRSSKPEPTIWGDIQAHRGKALFNLGEWETGRHRLQEALGATRAALDVFSKDARPEVWAQLQDNLGITLFALAERAEDDARRAQLLRESEAAVRGALQVYTRIDHRMDWARTHNHLGNTLTRLGELPNETDAKTQLLKGAVDAHGSALEAYDREEEPESWAISKNNRAVALLRLGEHTKRTEYLVDARTELDAALEVYTKERTPLLWANTHQVRATTLVSLAELGDSKDRAARLTEAVAGYHKTLEVFTREKQPLAWALSQTNLGRALSRRAGQKGAKILEESAAALRAALGVISRTEQPQEWALTQGILDDVLRELGQRKRARRSPRRAKGAARSTKLRKTL